MINPTEMTITSLELEDVKALLDHNAELEKALFSAKVASVSAAIVSNTFVIIVMLVAAALFLGWYF